MRRMTGRTPNFILIGLVFVIFLFTYKCWLFSSENDDLSKEIHKLQSELKMSGQKQEQYERTNQILQGNVHDLDEKQKKLKRQVEEEDQQLEEALNTLKDKENQIIELQNQLDKKEESQKDLMLQIDDKDGKLEELTLEMQHILTLKNDAEEALSERDTHINNLKREVEQAKSVATEYEARLANIKEEYSKLKQGFNKDHRKFSEDEKIKEEMTAKSALSPPQPPKLPSGNQVGPNYDHGHLAPVPSNVVSVRDIGLGGLKFYSGLPILPVEPRNAVRAKPRFSVADAEKEKIEVPPNQIQEPDSKANLAHQLKSGAIIADNRDSNQANNVIPNPPVEDQNHQVFQADNFINGVIEKPNNKASLLANLPQEVGNPVLPEPNIQHNNIVPHKQFAPGARNPMLGLMPPNSLEDNPDAAMDEDRKVVEDPADDQDEEGKEIKRDLDNSYEKGEGNPHADEANDGGAADDESGGRHEPLGIGAKQEIPRHEGEEDIDGGQKGVGEDDVNLEDDVNHHGNERVYEANLDHKIRNLGRP